MEIIKLTPCSPSRYFDDVALLHINEIHHGVIPLFGKKFLACLYCELSRTKFTGVWAALDQDNISGFIAGCADIKSSYRAVLLRPVLIMAALRSVCFTFPRLAGKLLAVLKYPYMPARGKADGSDLNKIKAELLSIAVRPDYRKQGIGGMLVKAFEKQLALWNVAGCYRVSTNETDDISNNFYKTLGFAPVTTTRLHALNLTVYVKNISACA